MKICDLYGAGYFYVPGTDTCMKIGGFVRFNAYLDSTSGFGYFGPAPFGGVNANYNRRDTQDINYRSRIWMTGDVRSQTALGTLRSYYAVQFTNAGPGDTVTGTSMVRAFIQLAGFTIGRTTSLFDLPDANSPLTNNGIPGFGGSTGPTGINAVQYTWQLGNGISTSIGIESTDQRQRAVWNLNRGAVNSGIASGNGGTAGGTIPEIVANIDVTQAWGSARLAGALHAVRGDYYTGVGGLATYVPTAGCAGSAAGNTTCAYPGDTFGYAIAGGFTITQLPGLPGDLFGVSAGYSHGASGYTLGLNNLGIVDGGNAAFGQGPEAVFVNGSGLELTDVWYVTAAYQHSWSPNLKSSIFGGYTSNNFSSTAKSYFCTPIAGAGTAATPATTGLTGVTNCNPDWSYWQIGSRIFSWTPVPNFNIGLDVVYWNFNSAYAGAAVTPAAGTQPAGLRTLGTENVWTAAIQIQRSFWP